MVVIIKKHKKANGRHLLSTTVLLAHLRKMNADVFGFDQAKTSHPLYPLWNEKQR